MAEGLYQQVVEQHARRLARVAGTPAVNRLRKAYMQAMRDVEQRLRKRIEWGMKDAYTAHMHRVVLAQLKSAMVDPLDVLAANLSDATRTAQTESLRALNRDITRLEREYRGVEVVLPTEEAGRFLGVIEGRATSVLSTQRASIARYGTRVIGKMESALAQTLLTGGTTADAIAQIQPLADLEWWQAERIARTELAWSYNETHADGIKAAVREVLPGIMQRWSEHVDDRTNAPRDARVAADSIAMHGQVAAPGGAFIMPPGADGVSPRMWGQTWTHPPQRPNDRAVLAPWHKDWGVPGWQWRDGVKRWIVRP